MSIAEDLTGKDLAEINPFDPDLLQTPYAYFDKLRKEAPVYRDPNSGLIYVATYDLVAEVNKDPNLFSNQFGIALRSGSAEDDMDPELLAVMAEGYPPVDTMLTADPPEHTMYRGLVAKAFSPKRVSEMSDEVTAMVHEIIDAFIADGHCEYKSQFGNELPMRVIALALGVPLSDYDKFRYWSDCFVVQLGGVSSPEEMVKAFKGIVEWQKYFAARVEEKAKNPTDDIISDLACVELELDDGSKRLLEMPETLSILQQLMVAGNETTSHTLTAGIYYLLSNPEQMEKVVNDYSLIPNMIEETLRFLTPTNNMWRVVTADTVLGGVELKKGEVMLIKYGCANRDEAMFECPNDFQSDRKNAKRHMAFGQGIHTCLGAQLARKEMSIAFPIVFDRLKNLRFAEGKNTFKYDPNILLRGVLEMHVEFDPA